MAPLRAAKNGGRLRRPSLPRVAPSGQATSMPLELPSPAPAAAAAAAAAPAPATAAAPAGQATPSSIDTYSTWLLMPPAFVSYYFAPMVQNSDLSALNCSMQEENELGSYPPGGFLNFMQRSSQWAAFVKSIAAPQSDKDTVYAQSKKVQGKISSMHLGCCNLDLTFFYRPARKGKRVDVGQIMQACIILHNMIIEDQRQSGAMSFDLNSTSGLSYALPHSPCREQHVLF